MRRFLITPKMFSYTVLLSRFKCTLIYFFSKIISHDTESCIDFYFAAKFAFDDRVPEVLCNVRVTRYPVARSP